MQIKIDQTFRNKLKEAIEKGKFDDWDFDGFDEIPIEKFDFDIAVDAVIELLQENHEAD